MHTTRWTTIKTYAAMIFLNVVYATKARQLWNKLCQWWFERNCPKVKLPTFTSPEQIWEYMAHKFQYRKDPKDGLFDYFSDPEKFHHRLLNEDIPDGDCDDVARLAAALLIPMKGVSYVYILHTGFNDGAHATVLFVKDGNWFHFDYGVEPIRYPMQAVDNVVRRYTPKGKKQEAWFWCIETYDCRPVAISPTILKG